MTQEQKVRIHPTAEVHPTAAIGDGSSVWNWVQIRNGAKIGKNCVIGKGAYVDSDVIIGNNCKIQNGVSVFKGVTIEDGVFLGPHVCFTNDLMPRAVKPDGSVKNVDDWTITETVVECGAALGANSTVVAGTRIGRWSIVGSGSVVARDVPAYTVVVGNPAKPVGSVCRCGLSYRGKSQLPDVCPKCGFNKAEEA